MLREEAIHELEDAKDGYAEYLSIDAIDIAIEALKQPEIITCGECKWYKTSSSWNCKEYHYCARESITASVKTDNDFCGKAERAERRTDADN